MNTTDIEILEETYSRLLSREKLILVSFRNRMGEMDTACSNKLIPIVVANADQIIGKLGMVVDNLNALDTITPEIESWGLALKLAGLDEADYKTIGSVFIDTMAYGLGNSFVPNIMDAWVSFYLTISEIMIKGAKYV